MSRYDTAVINGRVVMPGFEQPASVGIAIKDGRIVALAEGLVAADADHLIDARGLVVFPGAVDCHFHIGIYRPIEVDSVSETESSLVGGVTSIISYFRTGSHYLNKTGAYAEILPEVLSKIKGRSRCDYGFHLAPMTNAQIGEVDWLVREAGVASFKYYMFYNGLNLAASSTDGRAYTMSDNYDLGHLYQIMEAVKEADQKYGSYGRTSLSIHCESAALIKLFIERFRNSGLPPLETYSNARPPLSERLSIHEAGVLADASQVRLNLLHLSSEESVRAVAQVRSLYPDLDIRAETTLHHLCLSYNQLEGKGLGGKVNPPLRTGKDIEALWSAVRNGSIQWVASDHACCLEELKGDDVWLAQPGFGGTALLYPILLSEGYHKRGLALSLIADLAAGAPARAYALHPRKGSIHVGADADLALIDLEKEQVVTPTLVHSEQDHSPFEGVAVRGWPVITMLRGVVVFKDGAVVGKPGGEYLKRPLTETPLTSPLA